MSEHLSNGQFASKEVASGAKNAAKRVRGRPFAKGNPGKPKGTLNKTTRAVKEFLAELVDTPEVQEAVKQRIQKGDAVAFFRALEHVVGKPAENVNLSGTLQVGVELLGRLEAGRARVAKARNGKSGG